MDFELTAWRENILPEHVLGHDLAEGIVKNCVTNILGNLGPRDRTQAAIRVGELGLI
mgnify:CR=1 FL=1